jgi:hypothetical protein
MVIGKFHFPAALTLGKDLPVSNMEGAAEERGKILLPLPRMEP